METKQNYSFTHQVKDEIATNVYESLPRLKALLSAYIKINGKMVFSKGKEALLLETTNGKSARFIYHQMSEMFDLHCHMVYEKKHLFGEIKTNYVLTIDEQLDVIYKELEIDLLEEKVPLRLLYNDDTICGYLSGAFLASGSLNSPQTSNYHLEIVVNNENYAQWFLKILAKFKGANLRAKITKRREKYVIYYKKSSQISDFLIVIGAVSSCMEFENIRVDRDMFNSTNRLCNFDVANMKRTVETANEQIKKINEIDTQIGLRNLSNEKAIMLAQLRKEHESVSMKELADLLSEKLEKKVSKSTIYNLFRYLDEVYERISDGKK